MLFHFNFSLNNETYVNIRKFRLIKIHKINNLIHINYFKSFKKKKCVSVYLVIVGGAIVVVSAVDGQSFYVAADSGVVNPMKC